MSLSLNNILGLLGDKKIAGLLKVFLPDGFSSGKGRPRKVSFADKLRDGTDIAKVAMSLVGAMVLSDKGAITNEQMLAITAYSVEHLKDVDIVHCFPTSPKWIVKSALLEMGYDVSNMSPVTWDEFMRKVAEFYVMGFQGQVIQAGWVQAQKQGWKPEQYNEWLPKYQEMLLKQVSGQKV